MAPTWHHVPLWHPLSPLGSARGGPLGTSMLDWAQVGTCCQAAQLTHPGSTPLRGKHLAIPKISPLHLLEPKKTSYWLRYPNCPPPTFKCMTLHPFRVKGLGFPPTVTKVGQGAMNYNALLGRLGYVGHFLTPHTHLANSAPLHFG